MSLLWDEPLPTATVNIEVHNCRQRQVGIAIDPSTLHEGANI